jgi:hypothetical protein
MCSVGMTLHPSGETPHRVRRVSVLRWCVLDQHPAAGPGSCVRRTHWLESGL